MVSTICNTAFYNSQRGQLRWGHPTLDVFAGPLPGQHHAQQYYTKYWCAESLGADAFLHPWDVPHPTIRYQMAWIFPPSELIIRTLQRLIQQPVHATLVLPDKVAIWTALLRQLPIIFSTRIFPRPGAYTLGAAAPQAWSADMPRPLVAWRVWPGLRSCARV